MTVFLRHSPLRVTWDYLSPQFVDAYERVQWKEKNLVFKPLSHPPETLRFQESTSVAGKPQRALHRPNSERMRSVCVRIHCCACALVHIRLPEHSVRSVVPETGLFIQSRFFLTT